MPSVNPYLFGLRTRDEALRIAKLALRGLPYAGPEAYSFTTVEGVELWIPGIKRRCSVGCRFFGRRVGWAHDNIVELLERWRGDVVRVYWAKRIVHKDGYFNEESFFALAEANLPEGCHCAEYTSPRAMLTCATPPNLWEENPIYLPQRLP